MIEKVEYLEDLSGGKIKQLVGDLYEYSNGKGEISLIKGLINNTNESDRERGYVIVESLQKVPVKIPVREIECSHLPVPYYNFSGCQR